MKTLTAEQTWTAKTPCTMIIVKNESYLQSLQLLRNDVNDEKLRTIFIPFENADLFGEDSAAEVIVYAPDQMNTQSFDYGEALLHASRMRPEIVISEYSGNYSSSKTAPLFTEDSDGNIIVGTVEEDSVYPLDVMVWLSEGGFPFALTVEGDTIEESIRNLYGLVQKGVHKSLTKNLKLAYVDGKCLELTEDEIQRALEG